jgi:hypothetical protein
MECSYLEFLGSGSLGRLFVGVARNDVVAALGRPENWTGRCKWSPEESDFWVYGEALNLFFDSTGSVCAIRLVFDGALYTVDAPLADVAFAPLRFTDIDPNKHCEIDEFTGFLDGARIEYMRTSESSDRARVVTAGITATFHRRLDFGKSVAMESPVRSRELMLISVTAGNPMTC